MRTILLGLFALGQAMAQNSLLANAAQRGDRNEVERLLRAHTPVSIAQGDGMTALHWAAMHNDRMMAKLLLQAGAPIHASTRIGAITPLLAAARNGSAAVLELLLQAHADPNAPTATGATPLMLSAAAGDAAAVELLLQHGAAVNARDSANGQTALMFAAAKDRDQAIRVLLSYKADPSIASKTTEPACGSLFAIPMCGGGRGSAADPKPDAKPDAKAESKPETKSGTRRRNRGPSIIGGLTALQFAARDGRRRAVQALVEGGVDINDQGTGEKMTPLVMAISSGHYDLARYLLDHGADPNLAGVAGLTPLYAVLDMEWAPYAYRPQQLAGRGETTYLDLLRESLLRGANPNARLRTKAWFRALPQDRTWVDPAGATPFWRAAQANDVEAMRILVAAGADPKIPTDEGATALMVSAGLGWAPNFSRNAPGAWFSSVRYCLDLGLDVNAKTAKGYTALHGTAFTGNNDLIRFLIEKGADPGAVAEDKNTVADMANGPFAQSQIYPETVALLEKLGSGNSHDCRSDMCMVAPKPERKK